MPLPHSDDFRSYPLQVSPQLAEQMPSQDEGGKQVLPQHPAPHLQTRLRPIMPSPVAAVEEGSPVLPLVELHSIPEPLFHL